MILKPGSSGDTVESVQKMLSFLGFLVKSQDKAGRLQFKKMKTDGAFGAETQGIILNFQKSEGLLRDGVIGPITMRAMESAYTARILELNSPGISSVDGMPDRHVLESIKGDPFLLAYETIYLRSDAANAYRDIREAVTSRGGILPLSGGVRSLRIGGTGNRSVLSFHYTGLALDLYYFAGMVNPETDPFLVQRTDEHNYILFVRCVDDPDETELENIITYDSRLKGKTVKGNFLNLTALFAAKGFVPVKPRAGFEDGDSIFKAEWWHFQYEEGLIPQHSTFGGELLKIYSEDTLEESEPWKYRNHIFKRNWS